MKILSLVLAGLLATVSGLAQQQATTYALTSSGSAPSAPTGVKVGLFWAATDGKPGYVPASAFAANLIWATPGSGTGSITLRAMVNADLPQTISITGSLTTGSGGTVAGTLGLAAGTAPAVVANTVQHIAPTSVTGYNIVEDTSVGTTGYYKGTVSGTTITLTKVATIPAADIAAGALANGMTGTTQSGADNSTKIATTAYADSAVAGGVTASSTTTFSNKRVKARVTTITSNATPTVNTDNCDVVSITAQAAAITSMSTNLSGTPDPFDQLEYSILDNGTARAITWNSSGTNFTAGPVALPTTTTLSKTLHVYFERNAGNTTWVCMSSSSDL